MFTSIYFVKMCLMFNWCVLFYSKRVILLRIPGAEVSSGTNSEAMRITCAYCLEMFIVSDDFNYHFIL